jgi:Cysteine-rich secretory protein family
MYKKVSVAITMTLVMAVLLTVSWSALQRSQAQTNTGLENTALSMHNQERAAVGVPALTWSSSLAAESQAYANTLASRGYVCTFDRCDRLPHGASNENLAWGSTNYPLADLIQSWINEKQGYDGGPVPSGGGPAGHYTAMVWHSTSQVGCGTAKGAQIDILVCRYNPPGNFIGQTPFGGGARAVGEEENAAPPVEEGAAASVSGGSSAGGSSGG